MKKLKDPLKPYTTGNHEYNKESAFVYEDFNVPINNEEYIKLFKELTGIKNFLNEEKATYLEKIYEDSKVIVDYFKPLYELGLNDLVIDITGGAVRDFVLNNHEKIKDLDFMISYNLMDSSESDVNRKVLAKITKESLLKVGFLEEEIEAVKFEKIELIEEPQYDYDENVSRCILNLNKLMILCSNRMVGNVTNIFKNIDEMCLEKYSPNADDPDYIKMLNDRLSGVVKVVSDKLNYNVDLLVTARKKPEFLNNFDLNLCKASFSLINLRHENNFPKNFSHLTSRFSSCMDFFADVYNKKMTINIDEMAYLRLESCVPHIKRVLEKYPEYEVNIVYFHQTDDNKNRAKFIKTLMFKDEVELSLNNVVTNKEKTKLKV